MEIPKHWRLRKQRYALEGNECLRCKEPVFPPRPTCPECASHAMIEALTAVDVPEADVEDSKLSRQWLVGTLSALINHLIGSE